MTTPKQKTVNEPKTVRAVVPAAEAQVRLINASIEMLREYPFDQVTAREITKRAGLALTTISRNFGSMTGLFNQVSKALMDSALTRQSTPTQLTMFRDPDFILRSRLIAKGSTRKFSTQEALVSSRQSLMLALIFEAVEHQSPGN